MDIEDQTQWLYKMLDAIGANIRRTHYARHHIEIDFSHGEIPYSLTLKRWKIENDNRESAPPNPLP